MANHNSLYPLQKPQTKMSLLAFLFFMMGSVDLYGRVQRFQNPQKNDQGLGMASLFKLAALGAIAAGALEIGHLTHLVG